MSVAAYAVPAGRVRRSILSWLAGIGWSATTLLIGFVTTPWLLRWLGTAPFGAWEVVAEWMGYLGLTQVALGPAVITVFLLRAHTQGSENDFEATVQWALRLYGKAALAAIPAACALVWWAPEWLHAGAALTGQLRVAVAIAAVALLVLSPAAVHRAVLETRQRGYRVRMALLVQSALIAALSLWWAWAGWGVRGMAAATGLGSAAGSALWWRWSRRMRPARRVPTRAPVDPRGLWRMNWPLLASMAGNQVNVLTDNTIVGLTLGLPSVTSFFLTQRAVQLAGAQAADIGTVSWAALAELRAVDAPAFRQRVIELAGTVLGVSLLVTGTVAAFNEPFVRLWVGASRYAGDALTLLTAAGAVIFGYLAFFGWLLDTNGDTRQRLGVSTLGSALNLALSVWLARRIGLAGVALGTVVAYLTTDAWNMPRLVVREYGVPAGPLVRTTLHALLRGGAWAVAIWYGVHWLPVAHSWSALVLRAALAGVVGAAYGWAFVLRPQDRASWSLRWQKGLGNS